MARVMTISRSDGVVKVVAALCFAVTFLLLLLQFNQIFVEALEALVPEAAIVFEPVGDVLERRRLEPAGPPLRLATLRDQAGALQHLEVLGHRGSTDLEGCGQLLDRRFALSEACKDRAARRVGERREDRAEGIR